MTYHLQEFNKNLSTYTDTLVTIWNAACPEDLPISPTLINYNTVPPTGTQQVGCRAIAVDSGETIGFVFASHLPTNASVAPPEMGWIDVMSVHPDAQKQGVGTQLLQWAETWLQKQGCQRIHLGGSLKPFAPGLPSEFGTTDFFEKQGYMAHGKTWDVMSNVAMYTTSSSVRAIEGVARPARRRDKDALLGFLQREFPGRWHYECENFLEEGGRISDYMLLWVRNEQTEQDQVDGFCQLTFEDSYRPIERFYPYTLPRPWGQLGPIGVSKADRGKGYGAALIDASMRRFFNNGINGCIIDWTDLLGFYAKFGFGQYREYQRMIKEF